MRSGPLQRLLSSLPAVPVLLLGLHVAARASTEAPGSFAFASLLQPLTAQQTALGGPQACADGGAEALRANPAGLAATSSFRASLSHQRWLEGLQEEWVGGVVPLVSGALGIEISALHAGTLPAYAEDGTPLGSFVPVEMIAGIGYARDLVSGLRGGLALHGLSLSGPGEDLRGLSLTVGVDYSVGPSRLALVLRHVGADPEGERGSHRLPGQIAAGLERGFGARTRLNLTAVADRDGDLQGSGGLRVVGPAGVTLLGGAAYIPAAATQRLTPRIGVAFVHQSILVCYGYAPAEEIGSAHHISLEISGR